MDLGRELRKARLKAGLSQEKLAFSAGIDRTYVSLLENGHKSPTVDVLIRITVEPLKRGDRGLKQRFHGLLITGPVP